MFDVPFVQRNCTNVRTKGGERAGINFTVSALLFAWLNEVYRLKSIVGSRENVRTWPRFLYEIL